ncbi:hypothetical protein HY469_02830 [Candidatus Roizmanbacteria bacterium]|nr:hypothetical protein [Candidatus Roizmanbacteria bacterium]
MKNYFLHHTFLLGLFIVCAVSVLTILPLFHDGFFPIHDDAQIVRIQQMTKALSDGQFPVRWVSDLGYGYGYPIFNFYAPLPYYVGSFVDLIGFTPLDATKIMMGVGLLLAGICMYLLGEKIWGVEGGLISAMVYQFAPYHAVQMYVRGSIGELYAYAFIPLIIFGFYGLIQNGKSKFKNVALLVSVLGYVGLILSHNIIALLFTILLGISAFLWYGSCLVLSLKKTSKGSPFWRTSCTSHLYRFALTVLLAFGISTFFWLPALVEKDYTSVDYVLTSGNSDYHLHFLYPDQLWDSPWGFAGSAPGREDGMSFKIGKLHILFGILGVIGAFRGFRDKKRKWSYGHMAIWLGIILLALSVFMTLEYSTGIWETFPFFPYIQFPWRFLVFIVFFISLFAGGIVRLNKKNVLTIILTLLISAGVVFVNLKYFNPQAYYLLSFKEYESDVYVKWHISKISDEYLPAELPRPKSQFEIHTSKFEIEDGVVENQIITSTEQSSTIVAEKPTILRMNTAYFPGWRLFIDDQEVEPVVITGTMQTSIAEGNHVVRLLFTNTAVRKVANTISILSGVLLFGTMWWVAYEKKAFARNHDARL